MRRATAKKSPVPGPNATRNPNSRRWARNPVARFPSASTPLLQWKFEDPLPGPDPPTETRNPKNAAEGASARKLAAGMWRSEFKEIEPGLSQLQVPHSLKHGSNPKVINSRKFQSSAAAAAALPNPLLERATKWDAECSKPSEEVHQSFDHLKLLMDQEMTKASSVEAKLKAEIRWARARIGELETKHRSSKKQIESFLKKHTEEKASWRTREHEKIRAVIDGMRGDLSVERKNRRRTEVLNSKLADELAEAKKSAKRYLQDYEREKKARELVEEVCNELAREVGEDRTEAEEMKREAVRAREELEEERRMLQMAEVWREERVQMKLIDAKQAVEDRCSELKGLQMELEEFLSSRNRTSSDGAEIREAELLIEAVAEAVKMQEMNMLPYQPPPTSEDIFAIFEELQQREEQQPKEREVGTCRHGGDSPASGGGASGVDAASPATDIFLGKPTNESCGEEEEEDSEWETLSNSGEGSDDESNGEMNNKAPRKDNGLLETWKPPPCPDNGKIYEKTSVVVEAGLGLLSNLEQWSCSPESENPEAARGTKGCVEWPCGSVHKHSLKAKLLEARSECNKFQIRHVIKQKT